MKNSPTEEIELISNEPICFTNVKCPQKHDANLPHLSCIRFWNFEEYAEKHFD